MLISVASVLVLANLVALLFRLGFDRPGVYGLVPLFELDSEGNVPTFFSSGLWLLASAVTAATANAKRQQQDHLAGRWTTLAVLFLYLALDEASSIHELLIRPTRDLVETGGYLRFAWVIPAMVLLPFIAVFYRRLILSLPRKTSNLILFAAVIYVGGAIGMELVGGKLFDSGGGGELSYALVATLEETLEMMGSIVLLYALLDYMKTQVVEVRFRIGA